MAWFFDRRSRRFLHKSRKEDNSDLILERLKQYLQNAEGPIVMLSGFWDDQRDAISYQELRMLVENGTLDEATLEEWQQDYSRLVTEKMPEVWGEAILAGSASQPVMDHIASDFVFEPTRTTVLEWVRQRAALLVTSCTQEQQKAIAMLLEDQARNRYSVDELAKLIRPCIGLTKGQASAVRNFYDSLVASLTEQHPRTSPAKIHAQALDKAVKYAEQLHRQRARTIAITEMAYAYNFGADEGVRQAQDNLLLGRCVKRWNTSGDERVCKRCGDLSGKEVGMDERFFQANLPAYPEAGLLPPIHPRCACAVEYIEVEPPAPLYVTDTPSPNGIVNLECEDVTDAWLKANKPNNEEIEGIEAFYQDGKLYSTRMNGVELSYSLHEKRIAEILQSAFGVKVRMMPKVSGKNLHIKTPDFLVSNEPFAADKDSLVRYDLKGIEGTSKDAVYNAVHDKKKQAKNFVIEITKKTSLTADEIIGQSERLFSRKYASFVNRIIVIQGEKILRVFERKK